MPATLPGFSRDAPDTVLPTNAGEPGDATTSKRPASRGRRIELIDGMRGLAALYVAYTHIGNPAPWAQHGPFAVAVFIFLSGYCLMLPAACHGGYLSGGIRQFARRRARRILPPYYAALALSLLCAGWQLHAYRHGSPVNRWWLENLSLPNILAHVALVQTLNRVWHQGINPPLWSIATECQIYVVFALLLLPVWRRWGTVPTCLVAFCVGGLVHRMLLMGVRFDGVRPWYLGLFAFGMAAASLTVQAQTRPDTWIRRVPWGVATACLAASIIAVALRLGGSCHTAEVDVLLGACAACFVISGVVRPNNPFARVVAARPISALGTFSYSLYLVHLPAYWVMSAAMKAGHLSVETRQLVCTLFVMPFALLFAYGFHLAFERPFMRDQKAKSRSSAPE